MRNPLPPVPGKLLELEVSDDVRRGTPLATLIAAPSEEDGDAGLEEIGGVRPTGKAGDVQTVPTGGVRWLAGVGDGEPKQYRKAGAALVRAVSSALEEDVKAGQKAFRAFAVELPEDAGAEHVEELAFGLLLGGYRFTVTAEEPKQSLRTVRLITRHGGDLERVRELAAAAAFARDLANTPSNVKTPAWLAETAVRVAGGIPNLTVTARDEKWLAEQGFGGVLAVGGGSAAPPRLIELEYRPRGAKTHLLLVGKGITFDTGGLSIKPADGMHLMRTDMAGGAAIIAAVRAIAALRLPVKVTALVPAAENHVSGSSYRPGDIVRHYGGKTTEVGNTDAEGRMVLADALVYGIKKHKPDAVIDAATLTGAMKVSLGVRTGGVFATDDALAERVTKAGERVGEAWWRMPLLEDLAETVQGSLGDVRQAPGGPGGIVAALFLREFVGDLPWAHLDIAGPARADKTYADVVPGATGFAARTLVELVASYA
ncbi:leucyl aminopeptidase family protein [Amycolatopsis keratiniphila]|uniref:Probable cytosol aminopeptidase n=1 Tax=Amycolatopsis keratiniphila subsp. keratiniphila TaxID=227715 RepID=A0A1W2LL01_9PSEU|nr:leucyl aminopeptidase family protein [Amycolatopsis keratiniphila]ONF63556.1 peptidase M17 [Amycolatopsis keratiniphila subsp. keratiniphila]